MSDEAKPVVRCDPATLLSLAARAEAGGDVTLSDDCWRAMGWRPTYEQGWIVGWGKMPIDPTQADEFHAGMRPDLTRSIDVQEVVGPQVYRAIYMHSGPDSQRWEAMTQGPLYARAPTEPLARLAAKLRALAAGMERSDE